MLKRLLALILLVACLPQAAAIHALNFTASNGAANSDVRLVWTSTNLLPRAEHTAIWRYNPYQQAGYYAVAWHSPNNGAGTWDGGAYSFGTHPYPASSCATQSDGSVVSANATGTSGVDHCFEVAGVGAANDWLSPAGVSPGYSVAKDRWYTQVRRCHLATAGPCNGLYEHLYIPDYDNHPTQIITHCIASITGAGSNPAFYFGASDWESGTPSAGRADETPGGKLRGIQLYNAALSDADIATEVTNTTGTTPLTSAGQSALWYINQDPIPSDITDKSTAGHTPTWANANRPAQWDSTVSSAAIGGRNLLLHAGN